MPNTREKLIEIFESAERPITVPHRMDAEQARKYVFGEMADHLISNGVTVQQWIPVTERLPEERGDYLCYYKYEPDMPNVVCENTYYGKGRWMSDGSKVTHWMPLPQPPKEV